MELFPTLCGEGSEIGIPALFLRTQGCNIGCTYCDTRKSWPAGGDDWSPKEVLRRVREMAKAELANIRRVFITGGEPIEQPDLLEVIRTLDEANFDVLLQSAAPNWSQAYLWPGLKLLSIDVKGPAAKLTPEAQARHLEAVLAVNEKANCDEVQFKFLVEPIGYGPNWNFFTEMLPRIPPSHRTIVVGPVGPAGPTVSNASGYFHGLKAISQRLMRVGRWDVRLSFQAHKLMGIR